MYNLCIYFIAFKALFNKFLIVFIFLRGRGYSNHSKYVRSFKRSSKVKLKSGTTTSMPRKQFIRLFDLPEILLGLNSRLYN